MTKAVINRWFQKASILGAIFILGMGLLHHFKSEEGSEQRKPSSSRPSRHFTSDRSYRNMSRGIYYSNKGVVSGSDGEFEAAWYKSQRALNKENPLKPRPGRTPKKARTAR